MSAPLIVPGVASEQEVYLVLDDFGGRFGRALRAGRSRDVASRADGRPVQCASAHCGLADPSELTAECRKRRPSIGS